MGARTAAESASATATVSGSPPGQADAVVETENDGSAETAKLTRQCLFTFGLYTAALVKDDATKKWRGGTCVEVRADPASMMVDPNATVSVTATVRHKFEMADLEVPVVATLTGVQSLDPANKPVMAPATFDYVAGTKPKDQGTVGLKSTSKRGIGSASAIYTVKCGDAMAMMCPDGQTWNPDTCQCDCKKTCGANQVLNPNTCACVCDVCPYGQTLHPDTCDCTCDTDPMVGNPSPTCVWVGSVTITSNDAGQLDQQDVNYTYHWTWSFKYDASLSVTIPFSGYGAVTGTVTGNWDEQEIDDYSDPYMQCTSTNSTADDDAVTDLGMAGATVSPNGDGTFSLAIQLGSNGGTTISGTQTLGGDSCVGDPDAVYPDAVYVTGVRGNGSLSAAGFSGTDPKAQLANSMTFPDYHAPNCTISWDLKLVPAPSNQ